MAGTSDGDRESAVRGALASGADLLSEIVRATGLSTAEALLVLLDLAGRGEVAMWRDVNCNRWYLTGEAGGDQQAP